MSIPVAPLMIGMQIFQGAAGFLGQRSQAKQTQRIRDRNIANARAAAAKAATANYDQLNLRRSQEREAAVSESFENRVTSLRTQARARVAADEAGVAGNSVEATMRDLYAREAQISNTISTNLERTNDTLDAQGEQISLQQESTVNQAINNQPVPQSPDILGIATSTLGGIAQIGFTPGPDGNSFFGTLFE